MKKIGFTLIIGAVCLLAGFPSLVNKNQQPADGGGGRSSSFYQQLVAPFIYKVLPPGFVEFENLFFFFSKPT